MRSAIVIGAGIGGLATAAALHRVGWTVTVLEQAAEVREVGAGLTLFPNALSALEEIGVHLPGATAPAVDGGLRKPDGSWLMRQPVAEGDLLPVHRGVLLQALRDAVPVESLVTDATVLSADPAGAVQVRIRGAATELRADLIVAADGVRSTIRRQLWPDLPSPQYTGVTAWRGVTNPLSGLALAQTWGSGTEFGVVPLADGRIYW